MDARLFITGKGAKSFAQRYRRMRRFHRSVAKVKMWRSPSDRRERRAYAVLSAVRAPTLTVKFFESNPHAPFSRRSAWTRGGGFQILNNVAEDIFCSIACKIDDNSTFASAFKPKHLAMPSESVLNLSFNLSDKLSFPITEYE